MSLILAGQTTKLLTLIRDYVNSRIPPPPEVAASPGSAQKGEIGATNGDGQNAETDGSAAAAGTAGTAGTGGTADAGINGDAAPIVESGMNGDVDDDVAMEEVVTGAVGGIAGGKGDEQAAIDPDLMGVVEPEAGPSGTSGQNAQVPIVEPAQPPTHLPQSNPAAAAPESSTSNPARNDLIHIKLTPNLKLLPEIGRLAREMLRGADEKVGIATGCYDSVSAALFWKPDTAHEADMLVLCWLIGRSTYSRFGRRASSSTSRPQFGYRGGNPSFRVDHRCEWDWRFRR